jgi:ABC-type polysaccharide/polyol phosphate transport system ATPase subunit
MRREAGVVVADRVWKRFRADSRSSQLADVLRRARSGQRERWRWALRDVSFTLEPGEAVGLIGPNGSGKSTLLKILTGITYPYAGSVDVTGRVGALIEVRAGLHPDLTGAENVYFYGTLLGLKRADVAKRFDAIVDFAELRGALDRQVKFYSSGMQMRLGFAVAAFLEPDVLLVDEVLAVGDASFQQRCLDRMREVLTAGTTLVYVSHDLATVRAVCTRGILLEGGMTVADGPVAETLDTYRQWVEASAETTMHADGPLRVRKLAVQGGSEGGLPGTQERLTIDLLLESDTVHEGLIGIGISEGTASPSVLVRRSQPLEIGLTEVRCAIERLPLPRGRYFVWIGADEGRRTLLPWHPVASFDVHGPELDPAPTGVVRVAPIHVETTWTSRAR